MVEPASDQPDFNWRPLIYAAVVSTLVPLLIDISRNDRILVFGYYFLVIPLLCLILVAIGFSRGNPPLVFMGVVFAAVSVLGLMTTSMARPPLRWFFGSTHFKAQVLAQPENLNGELRHMVWDNNAIFPDTFLTYLVYDPDEGLSAANQSAVPGKVSGVPSGVKRVERLEKNWYALTFYENATWRSDANRNVKISKTSGPTID